MKVIFLQCISVFVVGRMMKSWGWTAVATSSGRVVMVVGGLLAASAISVCGGGVAHADDPLVGKTYADATELINQWKAHPTVASTFGDQLTRDKCIVSAWKKDTKTGKIALSLYCDVAVAANGDAGRSAASPEGRAAKQHDSNVKYLHENPAVCVQMKTDHPDWFKKTMDGCEQIPVTK